MKKTIFTILILLIPQILLAGNISINQKFPTRGQDIKIGDEILLEVRLSTENNFYNAIEGQISINGDDFLIKRINTGNNIITAWLENPSRSTGGNIKFSGIIAGGFSGNGPVFEILLLPKREGNLAVEIINSSIFLNDGLGTQINLENKKFDFNVRNLLSNEENFKLFPSDAVPPEPFEIFLTRDENLADGQHVLIFEAIDKGSGIRMYEVIEGKNIARNAQSPFILTNQKLNKKISVRAIDQEGNERLVRVNIPDKICVGVNCFDDRYLLAIIALVLIIAFIIWRKQSREFKKLSERV